MPTRWNVTAMPAKAFILIETARGKPEEIDAAVEHLEGLSPADCVTPLYDIVVAAEGNLPTDISDLVNIHIQPISGIAKIAGCSSMTDCQECQERRPGNDEAA